MKIKSRNQKLCFFSLHWGCFIYIIDFGQEKICSWSNWADERGTSSKYGTEYHARFAEKPLPK